MADIKIVIDTSADMSEEILKKYGFGSLSFLSVYDERSYVTGKDITNEQFYDMLEKSSKIPTTAQTPYINIYNYLLEESKKHETVIYFTISAKASGQNHTAHMAVEEIKEEANPQADIRIIDSEKFSLYISRTAIYAWELVQNGESADAVIDKCHEFINSWKAYLLVDDMKYLEKGGRIDKTTAIVGSLLDIKPILTIRNGLVEFEDKLRGKKKVLDKLIDKIEEDPEFDSEAGQFLVVHSDIDKGRELADKLSEIYGEGCVELFGEFGPVVGTHVGRGAVAVIFRIK